MRAQTTLDFLIGASIFLLAVGLTVGMVPGMLDPFATHGSDAPVAANRAVGSLAGSELAAPDAPNVLEPAAVATFFSTSTTEADVRTRLGLDPGVGVNVTLENDTAVLKHVGTAVPPDRSVTTAWRVVSYEGQRVTLTVRLW